MFHRCFQLTDGRTVWRCKAPQRCLILLEMVQRWKCSWFCRGILLWSWKWEGFPYQSQFHHPTSEWAESLEDNRSLQPLFERHRELNRLVLLLRYNVLWPNCYQPHFDLKWNVGKSVINQTRNIGDGCCWTHQIEMSWIQSFYSPKTKLSGRKICPKGPDLTESIVPGSRSTRTALGTYFPPKIFTNREMLHEKETFNGGETSLANFQTNRKFYKRHCFKALLPVASL